MNDDIKIHSINAEWKKQHSITADMCDYSIHIDKPIEVIGFYQNIILESKYDTIEAATIKANEVKSTLNTIDSYIRVSILEGLKK
jgi:hypothetical protein